MAASGESAGIEPSGSLGELLRRAGSRLDMAREAHAAGDVIAERYRLLTFVGSGGMGEVWRAEQLGLGRVVALKLLRSHRVASEVLRARLVIEARAATRVEHPGSVTVHDIGIDDAGSPYIAMEFVRGCTLASYLDGRRKMSPRLALDLAAQLGETLVAAHAQGVVHRDLKPENVILSRTGARLRTTILDFGLAKILADVEPMGVTRSGQILGSPSTMSPEQIRGLVVDGRSDVYALGCVLYWMLEGVPPFQSTDVAALLYMHANEPAPRAAAARGIAGSSALADLLARTLAKPAAGRPSARELVQHVRAIDTRRRSTRHSVAWRRAALAATGIAFCLAAALTNLPVDKPEPARVEATTPPSSISSPATPSSADLPEPHGSTAPTVVTAARVDSSAAPVSAAVTSDAVTSPVQRSTKSAARGRRHETPMQPVTPVEPSTPPPAAADAAPSDDWFDREFTRYTSK